VHLSLDDRASFQSNSPLAGSFFRLEPLANALAVVVVFPAKFRAHDALFGEDLKVQEEKHQRGRAK
jgi:hypothetical protein